MSFVGGEASQDRASWWLHPTKEAKFVGLLPRVHPLRLQSGVAQRVVLHKEPDGGVVPDVHQKETEEAGELVMGPLQPAEQAGDHRGGAPELL